MTAAEEHYRDWEFEHYRTIAALKLEIKAAEDKLPYLRAELRREQRATYPGMWRL